MTELVPAPFPHLLRRMLREGGRERKVFDLPARRFWRGSEDLDLSVLVHGRRVPNPVGPAAGPLTARWPRTSCSPGWPAGASSS